jgi:PqqD family protein of HPr-rel-A system
MDGPRWQLERRTELHWRRLDDEWVVFESCSGDTHRFDYLSAAALMCIETGPHNLDQLTTILASELGLPDRDGLATRLAALLGQLKTLGLIEPVGP